MASVQPGAGGSCEGPDLLLLGNDQMGSSASCQIAHHGILNCKVVLHLSIPLSWVKSLWLSQEGDSSLAGGTVLIWRVIPWAA